MSILPASLFAFALLSPGASFAQPAAPNPSFTLENKGSAAILEFYATPAGRANWGRDRLDGRLPPGARVAIRVPADGNCIYDLRATFIGGRTEDQRGLNVCQVKTVAMGAGSPAAAGPTTGAAAAKTFRLINRGTVPVTQFAARPQGTDKWLTDSLSGGPIAPGGERSLALPPGGQCVFDLRVTFEGGKAREKRAADLCKSPDQAVQQ